VDAASFRRDRSRREPAVLVDSLPRDQLGLEKARARLDDAA
jgi:hypothetical protein